MSSDKLKNKLGRFSTQINPKKPPPKKTKKFNPNKLNDRYYKLAEYVGGEVVQNQAGAYIIVRRVYPFDYIHGSISLNSARIDHIPLPAFYLKNLEGKIKESQLMFIDTETTGLGGSGVVPFLVGVASVINTGLEVRQYLMPDYHDEAAMLEDLLEEFTPERSLLSYNGASFDLPLLTDRMIINRACRAIPHEHHIDLLHGVRRIFKRRLKNCKLSNVEEKLFDLKRVDDLPGYLVPSVYFEWLNQDALDLMEPVMEHNRIDIVSLYFLVSLLAGVYESQGDTLESVDDLHGLARFFNRQKKPDSVSKIYNKIETAQTEKLTDDMILFHAGHFKRTGQLDKAVKLWESIAFSDLKEGYWANLELAKYYEHTVRDIKLAQTYTQKAKIICPYGNGEQKRVAHRLERLKKKLKTN